MTIHETMLSTFAEICANWLSGAAIRELLSLPLPNRSAGKICSTKFATGPSPSMLSTQTVCSPMRSSTVVKSSLTATQHCCGVSLPTLKKMMSWTRPGIWKCGCWRI